MRRRLWLVATLLLVAMLLPTGAGAQSQPREESSSEPEVFSPSRREARTPPEARLAKRSRLVEADLSLFDRQRVQRRLKLTLFDDVKIRAVLDRTEEASPGVVSWMGHVDGVGLSTVSFVVSSGRVMSGFVNMPGVTYNVAWADDGVHAVSELDQSKLPPDLHAHPDPSTLGATEEPPATGSPPAASVGSPQIDVMVIYSDDARAAAGGTAQIESKVISAVENTNQAYANSGISQRINLVHQQEMAYDDSANCGAHLNRITDTNDGHLDEVHALRDAYGADLVVLAPKTGSDCGGIAWVMQNVSTSFERYGFSMVRADRLVDLIMAHELGHNMGADHDDEAPGGFAGAYSYSRGFVDPTSPQTWVTVMAYQSSCDSPCTRVAYFSNPLITFEGSPMGIPEGQPLAADNTRTLNNTASTVAAFRAAVSTSPPGATTPISPSGSVGTGNPTFIWGRVTGASQYRLAVNSGAAHVYDGLTAGSCGTSTCSSTPTLNLANGNYSWTVQALNSAGSGPVSSPMSFSVVSTPAPVTLISPSGKGHTNPITFRWTASANATFYQILVNGRRGAVFQMWIPYGEAQCGTTCSLNLGNLSPPVTLEGSFTWYVQSSSDGASGLWSSPMSFSVKRPRS